MNNLPHPTPSAIRQFHAVLRHELGLFAQQVSGGIPSMLLWTAIVAGACIWLPWRVGAYWVAQPAFQIIYPLLASTLCIQSIVDSVTGERERGTLPSLLATPVANASCVLGKLGAVVVVAAGLSLGALMLGAATVNLAYYETAPHLPTPMDAFGVVALSILAPLLFAAMGFLVALRARTVRQGVQAYAASIGFLPIAGGLGYLLSPERFASFGAAFLTQDSGARWTWIVAVLALIDLALIWLCLIQAKRHLWLIGAKGQRFSALFPLALLLSAVVAILYAWAGPVPASRVDQPWSALATNRYRAQIEQAGLLIPLEIAVGKNHLTLASDALGIKPSPADEVRIGKGEVFARWTTRQSELHAQRTADDRLRGVLTGPAGIRFVEFLPVTETTEETTNVADPWRESQVAFFNRTTGQSLAGTLTRPKAPARALLVLVSGAGPQDRDHSVFGHRPFRDLAHYLAGQGYATLRYDDRGVGASEGDFAGAVTADFASDAAAALHQGRSRLPDTPAGLLGHSEGGLAVLMAAATAEPDFTILIATPARRGDLTFLDTHRDRLLRQGVSTQLLAATDQADRRVIEVLMDPDITDLQAGLEPLFGALEANAGLRESYASTGLAFPYSRDAAEAFARKAPAWWRAALCFDPEPAIAALDVPTLAVMGGMDWQLPLDNAGVTARALTSAPPTSRIVVLQGHNHLLQRASSGSPFEYGAIDHGMSSNAMEEIRHWLDGHFGQPGIQ